MFSSWGSLRSPIGVLRTDPKSHPGELDLARAAR
jgi:hypothetical protein